MVIGNGFLRDVQVIQHSGSCTGAPGTAASRPSVEQGIVISSFAPCPHVEENRHDVAGRVAGPGESERDNSDRTELRSDMTLTTVGAMVVASGWASGRGRARFMASVWGSAT